MAKSDILNLAVSESYVRSQIKRMQEASKQLKLVINSTFVDDPEDLRNTRKARQIILQTTKVLCDMIKPEPHKVDMRQIVKETDPGDEDDEDGETDNTHGDTE